MEDTAYQEFLASLRGARRARGLTQLAVADRLKLSRAQYNALENGRSMVTLRQLHELAVALDVKFHVGRKNAVIATRFRDHGKAHR